MIKPWKHIGTRRLASTRVFDLDAHTRVSTETGQEGEFYVLASVDWINVVAVTAADDMVFVRQYRHGTQAVSLEIPGGMVDDTDASPEAAARRELLEETGYASDDWSLLGVVEPNPAIQANRCFTFLARGARRVAEPAPEGHEEIEVALEPCSGVPGLLRSGAITHALVVAGLLWWRLAIETERG